MCKHANTTTSDPTCFAYSVAVYPYTEENRAAHGGISYAETCTACGAARAVNANGNHYEVGPWGPTAAQQEAERIAAQQRQAAQALEQQRQTDAALLASRGVKVRQVDRQQKAALVDIAGRGMMWISLEVIAAAAHQPENGDGLPQFYDAMRRVVADMTH